MCRVPRLARALRTKASPEHGPTLLDAIFRPAPDDPPRPHLTDLLPPPVAHVDALPHSSALEYSSTRQSAKVVRPTPPRHLKSIALFPPRPPKAALSTLTRNLDREEGGQEAQEDGWQTDWGQDQLKPTGRKNESVPSQKALAELPKIPFEHKTSPLLYSRRIEGVMEPAGTTQPLLQDISPPSLQLPVAQLRHGLDRVLFSPGVHWLQDPRSRVYNFDPYLQELPRVTDFAFERLDAFTMPSLDPDLAALSEQENRPFSGSTSSLSGILSHIYFLISGDRFVDTSVLSRTFQMEKRDFTPGQRMPCSVVFHYKHGRHVIDSGGDKDGTTDKNILTWLGKLLEKFITTPKEELATYRRLHPGPPPLSGGTMREAFRFAKSNKFIMRSQLDCHDPRLPGTGVFDIKTRACMSIRMDLMNFEEGSGYLIRKQYGAYESFEREYYDLIRSAFLKYQFQARIGNMDGVIVAFHNTERMFGFQYIPLEEMDERLFGPGQGIGDRVFAACLEVLENVAEELVNCFPKESVRVTFETLEFTGKMNVWIEPAKWDEASGERPIKQLLVQSWSYLNSSLAKPWEALCDLEHKWSLRWAISHLNASPEKMRETLLGAKQRQFRAWATPSGVDPEDLEEWYEGLNFSGREDLSTSYSPEMFTGAKRKLMTLRRLAREGRRDTERWRALDEDKPRHVLGQI